MVVGPTRAHGGPLDLLITDVPNLVRVAVVAPIGNSDHFSLSVVITMAQAVVAGLKRRFYQRLDNVLDAAPAGLLWVNRGSDVNRLDDLLTFMSNAIRKSGQDIFGMRRLSKFNVPGWYELAKELNARYREAVSHWNIAGRPRSGPLAELKCRARAAFMH